MRPFFVPMSKFNFTVNDSSIYSLECASGLYIEAAAASLAIVGNVKFPAKIMIWVPDLIGEYGPYLYLAKDDGCGNLIIGPGYERKDVPKNLKPGDIQWNDDT